VENKGIPPWICLHTLVQLGESSLRYYGGKKYNNLQLLYDS